MYKVFDTENDQDNRQEEDGDPGKNVLVHRH
jgi:hypothetical protein